MSEYYQLPKDKQWLIEHNNPLNIGGRDTDISQIAYDLRRVIIKKYPDAISIEQAKSMASIALAGKIETLENILLIGENLIQDLIDTMSKVIANE